ncbi:hypothetical protein DYB26_006296 [Aphanomyces astaci]|uniref:Uncharacterized protein n=1 Tax=Aphanomyces astaci TaxID=112090 RepID=A0A397CGD2_APHAT|nr:hypothetical protein DYB38_001809 [Aphanomyces astaci]RHY52452.1 hypothetical protein DYB34_005054 [Aphanomyces astaci]RHZ31410.1 hypothetical protein DYB26_006296 [Aphanomyces astaci]
MTSSSMATPTRTSLEIPTAHRIVRRTLEDMVATQVVTGLCNHRTDSNHSNSSTLAVLGMQGTRRLYQPMLHSRDRWAVWAINQRRMATILKTNPRSWKVPFLFIRSLPFPQHGPIELGINFGHIWAKTQAVLIPTKSVSEHILDDVDLAGPLVFAFGFGMLLLMVGLYHT